MYTSMAQRGTKLVASINEMVAAYESDSYHDQCRAVETRKDASLIKSKLFEAEEKLVLASTAMADFEGENKTLREKLARFSSSVVWLGKKKDEIVHRGGFSKETACGEGCVV